MSLLNKTQMNDWVQIVLVLSATLVGAGGAAGVITALATRRKASSEIDVNKAEVDKKEAETAEIITRAAGAAAELLSAQLETLKAENETMRCEIQALKKENSALKVIQEQQGQKISELQSIAEQFDQVLAGALVLYDQVVELNAEPKYQPPKAEASQSVRFVE
jgi:cell division protein FtsB